MNGILEEGARAAGTAISVIGQQPLALALVIMNFVLLGYLFYNGAQINTQRKDTVEQILKMQMETDRVMAACVSPEITKTMLDHMQKITDTMLTAEQKEIQRMQGAINEERQRSWELREREKKELDQLKRQNEEPPSPKAQRLSSPVYRLDLPPLPAVPPIGDK